MGQAMAVVTTGFFDGVHSGHRAVVSALVGAARERGVESIVVTFWPHPRAVLQDDAAGLRLLTGLDEKCAMLRALGVDRVEVIPFTRDFSRLTAADYLRLLRDRYGAEAVVVGYDNRIGSDRCGAAALAPLAASLGLAFLPAPAPVPVSLDGIPVLPDGAAGPGEGISSTKVRAALTAGDVVAAAAMLGYRYSLFGVVVAGNRIGRTIGFPTANMQLYEPLKLIPGGGVYAVEAETLGRRFRGMCNIGVRPTVGGGTLTIETHIFDFDEDIYGLDLRIAFLRKVRDERRFPSLDALRTQLALDERACRSVTQ